MVQSPADRLVSAVDQQVQHCALQRHASSADFWQCRLMHSCVTMQYRHLPVAAMTGCCCIGCHRGAYCSSSQLCWAYCWHKN